MTQAQYDIEMELQLEDCMRRLGQKPNLQYLITEALQQYPYLIDYIVEPTIEQTGVAMLAKLEQ
jgi:hypothetical protein